MSIVVNKYYVPYKLMTGAVRPLNLPTVGYLKVYKSSVSEAVCEAQRVLPKPNSIEVEKVVKL